MEVTRDADDSIRTFVRQTSTDVRVMVDPERLRPGDVVRFIGGRDIRDTGPDGADHLVAVTGDIGEVVVVEPWHGWFGELLGPWGTRFRVRAHTILVAFPDAPFGPVDCHPEELSVVG